MRHFILGRMGFPFFIIFIALAHHFSYALAETGGTGLSIRWKREIGTETYTRGITEKGRTTYIQAYNGFLYALDERGNKRWRVKTDLYENAFKKFNGVLYTGARDGYLLSINGDSGQELWRYKAEGSINGAPVIAGDLILFGSSGGILYAINPETGLKKWSYRTESGVSFSPAISEDKIVYVGSKDGLFYAISAEGGKLLWKFSAEGGIVASPVIDGDNVYFGARDEKLYSLNRYTGESRWLFNAGSALNSNPLIYGKTICAVSDEGILYGIDKETGTEIWRIKLERRSNTNLAEAGGVLYAGTDDLYAIDINNGKVIWRFNERVKELFQMEMQRLKIEGERRLTEDEKRAIRVSDYFPIDSRINSSPIIADGDISFGTEKGYLYLVNRLTGEIMWRFKTGAAGSLSPIADKEAVYTAGDDNTVYAFNVNSGQIKWKAVLYGEIEKINVGEKGLYAVDSNKRLYALKKSDGNIRWSHRAEGEVNGIYTMQERDAHEIVILQTDNEKIHGIDGDKGTTWVGQAFRIPDFITSPIAIENDILFFGSKKGDLYALQLKDKRFSIVWQTHLGKAVIAAPILFNNMVYAATENGEILGIDKALGVIKWRYGLKGNIGLLTAHDGVIYAVINEQFIHAIDAGVSKTLWRFDAKTRIKGVNVVNSEGLFVTADTGVIYNIDKADGAIRNEFKVDEGIASQPVSGDGNLFYITREGNLYTLTIRLQ
ncbi:MAG: PQQ-binding-like beta-propeller repeat protein [Nitrospirae bacterium]|nr:PQQ-binding-like beta-propeller repeat protein [Nitrospirota bacterium]